MRARFWVIAAAIVVAVLCGALAAAALLAWPAPRLQASDEALARVSLPGFAGRVTGVTVRSADRSVRVRLRGGALWPVGKLAAGERLTVELTARRPGWVAWLVGHSSRRSFAIVTPSVHLRGRWLQVKTGAPVTVAFDAPVDQVSFGGSPAPTLARPQTVVAVGVTARGVRREPARSRSRPPRAPGSACRRRCR